MNELGLSVRIEIIKFLRAGRGCNWIARRVFCHKETVWHYRELDKEQGYFRGLVRELFLSCRGRFLIHHSLRVDPVVIQGLPPERLAAYIKTGKVLGVLEPGRVMVKSGHFGERRL